MTKEKNNQRLEFDEMIILSEPHFVMDESEKDSEVTNPDLVFHAMEKIAQNPENREKWKHFLSLRNNYNPPEFGLDVESWSEAHSIAKELIHPRGWWEALSEEWRHYFQDQGTQITTTLHRLLGRQQLSLQARGNAQEKPFLAYVLGLEGFPEPEVTDEGVHCQVFQKERCRVMVRLPSAGYISIVMLSEDNKENPTLLFPSSVDDLQQRPEGLRNLFDYKFYAEGQLRLLMYFSPQPWTELLSELDVGLWRKGDDAKLLGYLYSQGKTLPSIVLNVTVCAKYPKISTP